MAAISTVTNNINTSVAAVKALGPKDGWTPIGAKKLDKGSAMPCAGCSRLIQTGIELTHPDCSEPKLFGFMCAGRATGLFSEDEKHDKDTVLKARRYIRWPFRHWHTAAVSGNPYVGRLDFYVVIYPRKNGFAFKVATRDNEYRYYSPETYSTVSAAKLAAFDIFDRAVRGEGVLYDWSPDVESELN